MAEFDTKIIANNPDPDPMISNRTLPASEQTFSGVKLLSSTFSCFHFSWVGGWGVVNTFRTALLFVLRAARWRPAQSASLLSSLFALHFPQMT